MSEFRWGETGSITVKGTRLETATYGPAPGNAPTIVLLHEGLGSVALWKDFPAKLSDATGWGIFVYSRAGYGQSDKADLPRPIDYMTREAEDVLPHVLNAFGFQNGILMGHSDGATIAAIHAGSLEDFRVRGLVLMAPHFFTEPAGLSSIAQAKKDFETGDLRQRLAKYHADVDNAFHGWIDAWLNPDFEDWNVAEVIDYLRIPTLAIQGRNDQYGTLEQVAEIQTRSYAPVDTVILDGCGHSPHAEHPQAVLDAVAEFTRRLHRIETVEVAIQ